MYEVDQLDKVVKLKDVPQSDVGAPLPFVVSDESHVVLAYLGSEPDPAWDGTSTTSLGPSSMGRVAAIIHFESPLAHMFGPPNDEAFSGHPLAKRGLSPYAAFEIKQSSWIRKLERMNSVHPNHRPGMFSNERHFIFAFHDSVFECIADRYTTKLVRGSIRSVLPLMMEYFR
jgi:hypothetical protein